MKIEHGRQVEFSPRTFYRTRLLSLEQNGINVSIDGEVLFVADDIFAAEAAARNIAADLS